MMRLPLSLLRRLSLFCAVLASAASLAAEPKIGIIAPHAVYPGKASVVDLRGEQLQGEAAVWTNLPLEPTITVEKVEEKLLRLKIETDPRTPVGVYALRLSNPQGLSSFRLFMVDDLPSVFTEGGAHQNPGEAMGLEEPVGVYGYIEDSRSVFFSVALEEGEPLSVEAVARRLGSNLDPVLRIVNPRGGEVAFADDVSGLNGDSRLSFVAESAGEYLIELRDSRFEGGGGHRYRLRVGRFPLLSATWPPIAESFSETAVSFIGSGAGGAIGEALAAKLAHARSGSVSFSSGPGGSGWAPIVLTREPPTMSREPNDSIESATRMRFPAAVAGRFEKRGDADWFAVEGRDGKWMRVVGRGRAWGYPTDLFMRVVDAQGKTVDTEAPNNDGETILEHEFDEDGTYYVVVEEAGRRGGEDLVYVLEAERGQKPYALSIGTDRIEAKAGEETEFEVAASRDGFDGDINIVAEGLPVGELRQFIIDKGKDGDTIKLVVPADAPAVPLAHIRLYGEAEIDGEIVRVPVSTRSALKEHFGILFPPIELDGLIGLKVRPQ